MRDFAVNTQLEGNNEKEGESGTVDSLKIKKARGVRKFEPNELTIEIAKRLIAFRLKFNLSAAALAELLPDTTALMLYRWENQQAEPKGLDLVRITRLLDISLADYPVPFIVKAKVLRAARQEKLAGERFKPVIDLQALLRMRRLRLGQSIADAAREWGIHLNTYAHWEQGNMPGPAMRAIVAEKLNLPISAICTVKP